MKRPLPYSVNELAERLQRNDKAAFSLLYDNYSQALLGLINTIVKDEDAAHDILQDVFVKIWRGIGSYNKEKGTLFTWMLNIARNTSIDTLRSKTNKQIIVKIDGNGHIVDLNNKTSFNTDTIGVKNVVSQLKAEHKELIDLVYFCGFTQEETASKLNMPLGTVKTRIRTALIELRKMYAEVRQQ